MFKYGGGNILLWGCVADSNTGNTAPKEGGNSHFHKEMTEYQ